MGCSPSKGKLFSKTENPGSQRALSAEVPQEVTPSGDTEKSIDLTTDEKQNELPPLTEEQPVTGERWSQLTSNTTAEQSPEDREEIQVTGTTHETVSEEAQAAGSKNPKKRKKNKGKKRLPEKQRFAIGRVKLDFPPQTVRAHQAAYAYLNPNISKYETLLGLLDQAAQTQLSLQPMMSALVLRFEEINQALEELAEEGDLMMKEYGGYMSLSSGLMGPVMHIKHTMGTARPPDPPPDLLQQLLQHSVEKMRLVGSSVQELGDTTLEDAVEYYASLSKVLFEKLQAKRTVEQRLTRVLACIEGAAMRKFNPEDSALHSEDSGIGGENESLPGSERHRHRGSAGSSSCGSGIIIHGTNNSPPCNSTNLAGHDVHAGQDEEEDDEDDNDEEYDDLDDDPPTRIRSNSSPPDPSHSFLYLQANYEKDLQQTLKRPLTATNPKCSPPNCGNIKVELYSSKKELDRQMQKTQIQGYKEPAGPEYNPRKPIFRRHSLSSSQKGFSQENSSSCILPSICPHPPKSTSVRKLINTFSQGVDVTPGQNLPKILPHIKTSRKSGVGLLSDTGNERTSIINGGNNNISWPDSREDLDADNLPPPPPEVLMDNSFQATGDTEGNQGRIKENSSWSPPIIIQSNRISQRLKASVQNVEVLPSHPSVKQRMITILPARPVRQDAVSGEKSAEMHPETEASSLYQQAHKIIHIADAAKSAENQITEQAGMGQMCDKKEYYEDELSCSNLPITAPPVSRVRLPPSCPSVCHRFPSPPTFKTQNSSRPSSRPGSPRLVERAALNNVEVIVPSVSFNAARSVFCVKESQNSQSSGFRGRLLIRRSSNSTRRTQSEQRPCMTSSSEFTKDAVSQFPGTSAGSANAE